MPSSLVKGVVLKADHHIRPLYTLGKNHIFLETFSPFYAQAVDFLVAIAEPVARCDLFHEYYLSRYSLFAAMAIGLDPSTIVAVLDRLSKTTPPKEMKAFIVGRFYTSRGTMAVPVDPALSCWLPLRGRVHP